MKRKWMFALVIILFIVFVPFTLASTFQTIYVNGEPVTATSLFKMVGGLPFVSIYSISNRLKLDVDHDEKTNVLSISNKGEPQSKVVATMKKAKATLYATEREGDLERFRLEVDSEIRFFPNWRNSAVSSAFGPRFFYEDINNDGKKELVVILTTEHGTGILDTEVHVLQKIETNIGEVYTEKLVDNPLAILHKNVKSEALPNDKVEVMIGKKKFIYKPNTSLIREHTEFSVYKNELVVYVDSYPYPTPEGAFLITYQFKDDMYQCKRIEYVKERPDFVMESSFH
jgi:hypothetical protein